MLGGPSVGLSLTLGLNRYLMQVWLRITRAKPHCARGDIGIIEGFCKFVYSCRKSFGRKSISRHGSGPLAAIDLYRIVNGKIYV